MGSGLCMFMVEFPVVKVANFIRRRHNIFMLVFDLTVAEVAERAGFSGVRDLMLMFVVDLSVAIIANYM